MSGTDRVVYVVQVHILLAQIDGITHPSIEPPLQQLCLTKDKQCASLVLVQYGSAIALVFDFRENITIGDILL